VSNSTRDGARIDDLAEGLLRKDAVWEMRQHTAALAPDALTACEILAVLAILRGAKERLDAQQRPAAPVLELVRPT
jgi:hypothetical protein